MLGYRPFKLSNALVIEEKQCQRDVQMAVFWNRHPKQVRAELVKGERPVGFGWAI